jgi:hypothetical protein
MFEVIWSDTALEELADVWVAVSPAARGEVEAAVTGINNRLADDPTVDSESRPDGSYVTFLWPIGVKIWISPAARTVQVGHFWTHRRFSRPD